MEEIGLQILVSVIFVYGNQSWVFRILWGRGGDLDGNLEILMECEVVFFGLSEGNNYSFYGQIFFEVLLFFDSVLGVGKIIVKIKRSLFVSLYRLVQL